MAIIGFENIAPDGQFAEVPDGYRGLNWKNFIAADDFVFETAGIDNAIHSGEAAAFNHDGRSCGFKSPDREDDFDLTSGFFAAGYTNGLEVKVFGFDDGERVARKFFTLDTSQELVTFGNKFKDIDEVKIVARSGDPENDGSSARIFAVDDLFLNL